MLFAGATRIRLSALPSTHFATAPKLPACLARDILLNPIEQNYRAIGSWVVRRFDHKSPDRDGCESNFVRSLWSAGEVMVVGWWKGLYLLHAFLNSFPDLVGPVCVSGPVKLVSDLRESFKVGRWIIMLFYARFRFVQQ